MHVLHIYEVGDDLWCIGLKNGRWIMPLSKADAIAKAKLRAKEAEIREIGVYNEAGELLEVLAV